ncbi:hypothetical protein BEH94_11530 [Candidatus Altiarchaeales archaeon WOR_SM1_SCG]|nr:hypothetical protein BEH94_11530 [Candidatus Altiarchaeales archaeon WOR_SM1_SCG]
MTALDEINELAEENRTMIMGANARLDALERMIGKNRVTVTENREMILENRKMVLENREKILSGREKIDSDHRKLIKIINEFEEIKKNFK